ncbi:hypothetical protein KRR55_06430 [Paeniglutamicibacter sp. ABSL32-1]|uniref:hypothetical protein n=1 Tax=Paeniglutamicibacter quisquiliarum TaxID=2849498 RepID=UPI001C2D63B4|nr:hypothetical protein [Paeniglutamicibacter quisquiliarum]MBV1778748.1 hypothetical protein [Paeniglutamicibacter quisquiliarum]
MALADNWKRARPGDPFWDEQAAGLGASHVAPLNELIGRLGDAGGVRLPLAAPWHGGIHAPALIVLNDAGEPSDEPTYLCVRNPDRAAERQRHLMTEFGIDPADFCPWNGYPWPRIDPKRDLTPEQSLEGGRALLEVMALMTDLKMLLLLGRKAQDAADAVLPDLESAFPDLHIVRSLHPLGAKRTVDRVEQKRVWAGIADRLREGKQGS